MNGLKGEKGEPGDASTGFGLPVSVGRSHTAKVGEEGLWPGPK